VDLTTMTVSAPPNWYRFRQLGGITRHEIKHASADGQPCTYRRHIDHTAAVMKALNVGKARAHDLLNIVYDVCVDRLVNARHSIKEVQREWLRHFPITQDAEGTENHLLNVVYKDLFGVELGETEYERELRTTYADKYEQLKNYLLSIGGGNENEDETKQNVVNAAVLVDQLVKKKEKEKEKEKEKGGGSEEGKGEGGNEDENKDEGKDRGGGKDEKDKDKGKNKDENKDEGKGSGKDEDKDKDKDEDKDKKEPAMPQVTSSTQGIEDEVFEIALDNGLEPEQVADLLECSPQQMEEMYEDYARRALWQAVAAYRGKGSTYAIQEPYTRKWKPWDRAIDPDSIARHPHEPERWMAVELQPTIQTEQYGGDAGAESVVVAVDNSGSMELHFAERSRLAWAKDAALGLIAFAKESGIPVECFSFSDTTRRLSRRSRDYLVHAKQVLALRPEGGTHPETLVQHLQRCDEGTLVAVITDGCFPEEYLRAVTGHVKRSKVICAVVDTESGVNDVTEPNLEIYAVRPSAAGVTLVERAKRSTI